MLPGLSSYTYPWAVGVSGHLPDAPLGALALLSKAIDLGAQALQLGDNLPVDQLSPTEWARLRERATAHGIQLEIGARGLTPNHLGTYLTLADEARAPFLRFVIDDGAYQPTPTEVITSIRDALPRLREQRTILALENHDRFTARQLRHIIEETDPVWVGICLDTTNSFGAGEDLQHVVSVLAPYVVNLHAKAFAIRRVSHKMGFLLEGACPGTGPLDLPAVLDQLRPHGRCLTVTLEQWPPLLSTLPDTIRQEAEWAEKGMVWIQDALASR